MADAFTVDFVHMPWPGGQASWRYYGREAWEAVRQTVGGKGERLTILCPASGNPHLAGVLRVESAAFRAEVTVQGDASSPPVGADVVDELNAKPVGYGLDGAAVTYALLSDREVTITLEAPHAEKPEHRMEHLVDVLWQFQFVAIDVKRDVFNVGAEPLVVEE